MKTGGRGILPVLLLLAGCAKGPPLPVYGQVPRFQLTAQDGRAFDRASLDGRIWVADFIFTTCPGPCPLMSRKMQKLQGALRGNPDVRLVSFTVDPQRDTPEVLAEYARRYQADPARWFFLTGDQARLHSLGRDAFKLHNTDGTLVHSTRFVLLDGRGRIRAYYNTQEEDPVARVLADIGRLRGEKS